MKPPRLSIAGLMLAVCMVAVGIAALKNPSESWASWVFAATVGAFLFALCGAILRQGNQRVFWVGFLIFGVGYLALALMTGAMDAPEPPTGRYLLLLDVILSQKTYAFAYSEPSPHRLFCQIGHSLLSLLFALLGTLLVRVFTKPDEPTETPGTQ